MKRYLVLVAAVVLAACGSESKQGTSDGNGGPHVGTVPVTNLVDATTSVKVVLKTTQLVDTPITVYNADTDDFSVVPCTVDATCTALNAGAACKVGLCQTTAPVSKIFYVKNLPRSAAAMSVPCDGGVYTAEVYGAGNAAAGLPLPITEMHISAPFTMPTSCVVPTLDWNSVAPPRPTYVFPLIYAGLASLGTQFETFTVSVNNLTYPWSRDNWSLTHSGQDTVLHATKISGAAATFTSPTTTAPLSFTGNFHLNSSLLVTGETATSWELVVLSTTDQVPVGSVAVPLP
jgi:hypothetical protein